jgi:SAM-dependent methyltransferase
LQRLACDELFNGAWNPKDKTLLQFAPDPMTDYLRSKFGRVVCADVSPGKDRIVLDMRAIEMKDESVDAVFASHVLEHIREDEVALREVYRVLKPGGIAILPVPIVSDATIEYPEAVATEEYHWRAPGSDYFDRYREVFGSVRILSSRDFDEVYQTYDYSNRTVIDRKLYPYRQPMTGDRHPDFVPICFK